MVILLLVLESSENRPPELSGLKSSWLREDAYQVRFDLELHLRESEEGLQGLFVYRTDLFNASSIARMAKHYQTLLDAIAENPDCPVGDYPLLTEAERRQLTTDFNATTRDYPRDKCVHALFEEQVSRTPDQIAVVFGEQQLTYRELNERSNQLARHLRDLGVGPDVLVGICLQRSLEMLVGILGILKAGGAYVPLDPSSPAQRMKRLLDGRPTGWVNVCKTGPMAGWTTGWLGGWLDVYAA